MPDRPDNYYGDVFSASISNPDEERQQAAKDAIPESHKNVARSVEKGMVKIGEKAVELLPIESAEKMVEYAEEKMKVAEEFLKKNVKPYVDYLDSTVNADFTKSKAAPPNKTLISQLNKVDPKGGSNVVNVTTDDLGYMRYSTTEGSVCLHMPTDISDQMESSWEDGESAIDRLKSHVEHIGSSAGDTQGATVRKVAGLAESLGGRGYKHLSIPNLEGLQADVMRKQGLAENPHSVQFFKGMSFKSHSFKHKLIAFTEEDTYLNLAIVQFFKKHMKPQVFRGKFLSYPSTFNVAFMRQTVENTFLPKIRPCACTNVEVSYTGSGTWSSFYNGSPVDIDLTLQFNELDLPYNNDTKEV